jgi:peptidoglycan-associated lipoprotein
MKLRFLSIFAAVALLAACDTPKVEEGAVNPNVITKPDDKKPSIVAGSKEDFVANVGDRVFFDFDKSSLRPEGKATLAKQAAWLKQYGNFTLTIEGHADERGTREYNIALGAKRANAVKEFLKANGVADTRVKVVSYGKERPVALGSNEAAWSQNRRGVTVLN